MQRPKLFFIGRPAILAAAIALAGCGLTDEKATPLEAASEPAPEIAVSNISAMELSELLSDGDIRLIDVRRDEEVAMGIIPGAEHIVLDDFDPARLDLSDGREVVFYCRSGRRSGQAAERMASHTGKTTRHLEGGILAWQEAGFSLTQP